MKAPCRYCGLDITYNSYYDEWYHHYHKGAYKSVGNLKCKNQEHFGKPDRRKPNMQITSFMALIHSDFAKLLASKEHDYAFSTGVQLHLQKLLMKAEISSLRKILDLASKRQRKSSG